MSQLHPETGEICQHETGTTEHSAEHEEAVAAQLGRCPVPRGAIVNVIDVEVPATKPQGSAEHERWHGKVRNYSLGNERAKTPEREKKRRGGNNMSDMRRPS